MTATAPATVKTLIKLPRDLSEFFRRRAKQEGRFYDAFMVEQLQELRRNIEATEAAGK